MRLFFAAAVLFGLASAAVSSAGADTPAGQDAAGSAMSQRGTVIQRTTAERSVAFRPFVPDAAPTEVALLPPFHGDAKVRANEGIGYAYGRRGQAWLLSEWPRNGGSLRAFARLRADGPCGDVHAVGGTTKPRGVVWSTPRGLVLSLTSDGTAEPATIVAEFQHLARRGACR